jgi:phytoene/squalene synthetase
MTDTTDTTAPSDQELQQAAQDAFDALPTATAIDRARKHLARLQRMTPQIAAQQTAMFTQLAQAEAMIAEAEWLENISYMLERIEGRLTR